MNKQYCREIHLSTPCGDQNVSVHITIGNGNTPVILLALQYNGQKFCGHGIDYLWIDAFSDLQKQLPQGVTLKCCLTCRHGNMCPVGNAPDELFCTKDVSITRKRDLFFYTEDAAEREKRLRSYTDLCDDYLPQCEDYFTYTDFKA